MKKTIAVLCGLVTVLLVAAFSNTSKVVTPSKDTKIDLKYAEWDKDTMMGLDCWVENYNKPGEFTCKADGPPTLPDYCQVYVTYTCGCEETYERECNDFGPMVIREKDDVLYIEGYDDCYTDECHGQLIGDVVLLPDGTTLPAEACPKSSDKEVTVIDDSWRTFDYNAHTIDVEGDCWISVDDTNWRCSMSEGECWVTFTHTWTGATFEFYASCKEEKYMRLWLDGDGDWCIADWDKMTFKLKKDQ
jgi:hypothetical protein